MTSTKRSKESIDQSRFIPSYCEIHGWFEGAIKTPDGVRYYSGCPQCEAQRRVKKAFGQSAIPLRFADKRFSNYLVSNPSQQSALATCELFFEELLQNWNCGKCLILTGKPGTGKTHLACAILHEAVLIGRSALFTTLDKMLASIKDSWTKKTVSEAQIIDRYGSVSMLAIDEIGAVLSPKDHDFLFQVVNERYERMLPTVFITNLPCFEDSDDFSETLMRYLQERIVDRLRETGRVVVFDWESFRGKQL